VGGARIREPPNHPATPSHKCTLNLRKEQRKAPGGKCTIHSESLLESPRKNPSN